MFQAGEEQPAIEAKALQAEIDRLCAELRQAGEQAGRLMETIRGIGDIANKALEDETGMLRGVTLRDIVFRCADVLAPGVTVGDDDA